MKLSGAVMDVVRGIGGAALIAASASGCGSAPSVTPTTPATTQVVAVRTNDAVALQPKPGTTPISYDPQPDYAAACGRG